MMKRALIAGLLSASVPLGGIPAAVAMTPDEMGSLMRQLLQCWVVPKKAGQEDIAVVLNVTVNPDRSVAKVEVADQSRFKNDVDFRSAAEAATRVFHNPYCSPLALPPDKYAEWQFMTVSFDPKELLGK